jgi:hypothetical protein
MPIPTAQIRLLVFGLAYGFGLVACSSRQDDPPNVGGSAGNGGSSSGSGGTPSGWSSVSGGTGGTGGRAGSGGTSGGSAGRGAAGRGGTDPGEAGAGGDGGGTGGSGGSAGTNAGSGGTGPIPSSDWVNATGNLANLESECGNLTLLSAVPASGTIIAGVAKVGLFASSDSGETWEPLGTGAGSAVILHRPSAVVYDTEDPSTFWVSGIYNGPGLFKTTNAGETFQQLGDITHNDLVSIDFTDPERKTLLVGGHEQKQTLYLSRDGGETFDQIGMNLPAGSHFSSLPLVIEADTFLVGSCGYGDGECGVYRSTDGGEEWERTSDLPAAARPLVASDGSIYWSLIYDSGIARSTDDGETFAKTSDGILTSYPTELPDGRILAVKGDHVAVSADQGSTWTPIGETLPWKPAGVVYSVAKKTLFVWKWDCGSVVLPDAIASAGFDYEAD